MTWATFAFIMLIIIAALLSGCYRTGIPECDYTPGKIKGGPVQNCPGVVYYNAKEGKCMVQAAGMGTTCPESAFKVDQSSLLEECKRSAQNQGDIDYCEFRVAERIVDDAMTLCQDKCENLK